MIEEVGFLLGVVGGSATVLLLRRGVPIVRSRYANWRRVVWRDRVVALQRRLVNGDETIEDDLTRAMAMHVRWIRRVRRYG